MRASCQRERDAHTTIHDFYLDKLLVQRGILDGWHRCYYVFQRIVAEILLSMRLIALEYNKK